MNKVLNLIRSYIPFEFSNVGRGWTVSNTISDACRNLKRDGHVLSEIETVDLDNGNCLPFIYIDGVKYQICIEKVNDDPETFVAHLVR